MGPCINWVYAVDRQCWRRPKRSNDESKKNDYEMDLIRGDATDGKRDEGDDAEPRSLYQKRGRKSRVALHRLLMLGQINGGGKKNYDFVSYNENLDWFSRHTSSKRTVRVFLTSKLCVLGKCRSDECRNQMRSTKSTTMSCERTKNRVASDKKTWF